MDEKTLTNYLGGELYPIFLGLHAEFVRRIEEIRIRLNQPVLVYAKGAEYAVNREGTVLESPDTGYKATKQDILKTMELMSNYSLYSLEEELKNGYLTLPGGHRVGISGKAVTEQGHVKTISHINGLNIRISHQIFGCSDKIMAHIAYPLCRHTLIISPPACGKTTLLRDIIRNISNGLPGKFSGLTVGVVDERSEIAGCYMGVPQNDVGIRTDVLDACPKVWGMTMFLRSMAPKVIAVDEVGRREDVQAIDDVINAGVKIICTVHGNSLEDLLQKPVLSELIHKKIFERFVVLCYRDGPGRIAGVYDNEFRQVAEYDGV